MKRGMNSYLILFERLKENHTDRFSENGRYYIQARYFFLEKRYQFNVQPCKQEIELY